jgi:hypothetical protein
VVPNLHAAAAVDAVDVDVVVDAAAFDVVAMVCINKNQIL